MMSEAVVEESTVWGWGREKQTGFSHISPLAWVLAQLTFYCPIGELVKQGGGQGQGQLLMGENEGEDGAGRRCSQDGEHSCGQWLLPRPSPVAADIC